jgi:glutamate-1-semialdehyde 2,1-aminomutase
MIDYVGTWGPAILGHAPTAVIDAVTQAAKEGVSFGIPNRHEVEMARVIRDYVPSVEKVRMVSSGTEATMSSIRLARGFTKRDKLVKFEGCYHGHVDSLLMDGGSGLATLNFAGKPDSLGIPEAVARATRVIPFNDEEAIKSVFEQEGESLAAVIIEPIMGNMGVIPPAPGFLALLRELCTHAKTLLIFDEVMTGLRVHRGSAQALYEVSPDLTTLGKIIGGGAPVSALLGPAKWMNHLAPLGGVYQAGTLSGNPLSLSMGLAMLELIDRENPYTKLEELGAELQSLFEEEGARVHVPIRVERVGSMISVFFRRDALRSASDATSSDTARFTRFFWALAKQGILLPPSPFEAC